MQNQIKLPILDDNMSREESDALFYEVMNKTDDMEHKEQSQR